MLAGIVEQRLVGAVGRRDDLLDGLAFETRAFEQLVAGIDIGLVVLVVVELEGLLRHVGAERVVGVGQFGQGEGHRQVSRVWWHRMAGLAPRDARVAPSSGQRVRT